MDINKVRDVLSKKKIVLLGESAHGIKEQNNNRVELIKKLHQEEGFNLLFIESVKPSKGLSSYSIANDFVRNELHEVYHTEEVLELVEYALNCNLELRGFELYDDYLDEYYKVKNSSTNNGYDSRTYRDLKMFEIFQSSYNVRKDKAIIWGHNAHMAKKASPGSYRKKVFGEYIKEFYGANSHSIGQLIGSGVIEHMKGQERSVEATTGSVEKFIMESVDSTLFVPDLSGEFYNKSVTHASCGGELETIILADLYDSLILDRIGSKPVRLENLR